MTIGSELSRRSLLACLSAAPLALRAANDKIPIGLELYSVRDELKKDDLGTLDRVAKMGYEIVEFYSPYYDWTPEHASEVRKKLDDLGMRCYSTHNSRDAFSEQGLTKAIALNKTLGAHYIVMAHPGKAVTLDDWQQVAETLSKANDRLKDEGMHAGYHNHELEWKITDGKLPLAVIADNTPKSVMMQLDVGTCVASGNDPVTWIDKNPGRIRSLHLKDWGPGKGYRVLFGEGAAPWKGIFAAAERAGGVEYYLIEQEGSEYPEFETVDRCLVAYKQIHG